ncbi:hypothetical protein F9C07_2159023 [Aspergillus flavus]|uniref:Uncharacterized protein n=1 Tax=Aspergillus flavus (strain ATCC 200026 / FGSC A1120 / IAM 13836 / NRRL 3357 / JCM 12722 / SRRC 167) TaxID=332952 RepID=A0A7U2MVH4_ASPFN|nr:hypothetical protein F9C07_2159023 [Aspergillus flavus]
MSQKLSPDAEAIRQKIKAIILEINNHENSTRTKEELSILGTTESDITYGGTLLRRRVSDLVGKMNIAEDYILTVTHFLKPTTIRPSKRYVIALSDEVIITPGGKLEEGSYTLMQDEFDISPGASVVFVTLKV